MRSLKKYYLHILITLIALAHAALCLYLAHGNLNLPHDGVAMKPALDIYSGKVLFRDTFYQYGILGPYVHAAIFKIFGTRLLFIKYATAIYYSITLVALFYLSVQFLPKILAFVVVLLWWGLAPYYWLGMQVNPIQEAIMFSVIGLCFLQKRQWVWTGACFALAFCFRQVSGVWVFLSMYSALAISELFFDRSRDFLKTTLRLALGYLIVLVPVFLILLAQGALIDWYKQTILFPSVFYIPGASTFWGRWYYEAFVSKNFAGNNSYWPYFFFPVVGFWLWALVRRESKNFVLATVALVGWLNVMPIACDAHYWWSFSFGGILVFVICFFRVFRDYATTLVVLLAFFSNNAYQKWVLYQQPLGYLSYNAPIESPKFLKGVRAFREDKKWLAKLDEDMAKVGQLYPNLNLMIVEKDSEPLVQGLLLYGLRPNNINFHKLTVHWPKLNDVVYSDYFDTQSRELASKKYIVLSRLNFDDKDYVEWGKSYPYRIFVPKR